MYVDMFSILHPIVPVIPVPSPSSSVTSFPSPSFVAITPSPSPILITDTERYNAVIVTLGGITLEEVSFEK